MTTDNAEPRFNITKTAIWIIGSLSLAILGFCSS